MTAIQLKKQFEMFFPLLSVKQQELVLDMVKSILHVEPIEKRISKKQYNNEIQEARKRIASGKFKTHEQAIKELSKW
jgi:predicted transcriptional regulator